MFSYVLDINIAVRLMNKWQPNKSAMRFERTLFVLNNTKLQSEIT